MAKKSYSEQYESLKIKFEAARANNNQDDMMKILKKINTVLMEWTKSIEWHHVSDPDKVEYDSAQNWYNIALAYINSDKKDGLKNSLSSALNVIETSTYGSMKALTGMAKAMTPTVYENNKDVYIKLMKASGELLLIFYHRAEEVNAPVWLKDDGWAEMYDQVTKLVKDRNTIAHFAALSIEERSGICPWDAAQVSIDIAYAKVQQISKEISKFQNQTLENLQNTWELAKCQYYHSLLKELDEWQKKHEEILQEDTLKDVEVVHAVFNIMKENIQNVKTIVENKIEVDMQLQDKIESADEADESLEDLRTQACAIEEESKEEEMYTESIIDQIESATSLNPTYTKENIVVTSVVTGVTALVIGWVIGKLW